MSDIAFFTLLFIFYFIPMFITMGFILRNRQSKNIKGLYFIICISITPIINIWGAFCALSAVSK